MASVPWFFQQSVCRSVSRLPLAALWLILAAEGQCQGQSQVAASLSPPALAGAITAKFDTREIKTAAEPGVGVVELSYEFTNTGEIPLVVEEFSQSCGCMQGSWNGVPVAPGARGKITAKLLTTGLRGTVRKALRVKFLEGGVVELVGEVKIPEAVTYSAQTLRWGLGETPGPKQVDIVVTAKAPLRVLSVSVNSSAFARELLTIEDGRRYRIIVTPRDTAATRVCVLQVRTDSKDPRDSLKGLFALVEEPKRQGGRP